jgi:hypothetical protein
MRTWHGVLTATATPFTEDLAIDFDRYQAHVAWLAENGTQGVVVNGSLGEYQVLTPDERAAMVKAALDAAPVGFNVVPGVGAYGATEARRWAEHAAGLGAKTVMCLPPNAYRANDDEVLAHFSEVGKVGIPIIAYNNPFDTRVDLTPRLLARIADEVPNVVAVKEFTGDVRRVWQPAVCLAGLPDSQTPCRASRWIFTTLRLLANSRRHVRRTLPCMIYSLGILGKNSFKRSSLQWIQLDDTAGLRACHVFRFLPTTRSNAALISHGHLLFSGGKNV